MICRPPTLAECCAAESPLAYRRSYCICGLPGRDGSEGAGIGGGNARKQFQNNTHPVRAANHDAGAVDIDAAAQERSRLVRYLSNNLSHVIWRLGAAINKDREACLSSPAWRVLTQSCTCGQREKVRACGRRRLTSFKSKRTSPAVPVLELPVDAHAAAALASLNGRHP